MDERVTIYDIAREAGASPATVSRVLNHSKHPVKQELREKIIKISDKLGYIPNLQARSLKRQTSNSVGVIIPSIANPFYPSIVKGIEDEIVNSNCHMLVFSSDEDIRRTNYSVETLVAMNVQGIISVYVDEISEALGKFAAGGGLVLNVTANKHAIPCAHTIFVDKVAECKRAMNYLISLGHRNIATIIDTLDISIRISRLEGYRQALAEAGIPFDDSFVYIYGRDVKKKTEDAAEKGYLLAKAMLKRSPQVSAFICMNDSMALGALKAIREAGKKIPEDYSMVSFDNLIFTDFVYPSFTTVGYDQYEWGHKLASYYFKLLKDTVKGPAVVQEKDVLSTSKLIIRQSTRQF